MEQDERDRPQGHRSASKATTGKALWLGVYVRSNHADEGNSGKFSSDCLLFFPQRSREQDHELRVKVGRRRCWRFEDRGYEL